MPADNKHIGKMSAEVTIRIFARPLTFGVNPNSSAYEPTLRQYAGTLYANRREYGELNTRVIESFMPLTISTK
jgi:hypothetical protein